MVEEKLNIENNEAISNFQLPISCCGWNEEKKGNETGNGKRGTSVSDRQEASFDEKESNLRFGQLERSLTPWWVIFDFAELGQLIFNCSRRRQWFAMRVIAGAKKE